MDPACNSYLRIQLFRAGKPGLNGATRWTYRPESNRGRLALLLVPLAVLDSINWFVERDCYSGFYSEVVQEFLGQRARGGGVVDMVLVTCLVVEVAVGS